MTKQFILVDDCPEPFTLENFLENNDGVFTDRDVEDMDDLEVGHDWNFNMGAGGLWTLRRVE
jgi:hypothetical protein